MAANDPFVLENATLRLTWANDVLAALNKRSGRTWRMAFPAFEVELDPPPHFELIAAEADDGHAAFRFADARSSITADLAYELDGDRPWFRKRLILTAPAATPTCARVVVDRQSDAPAPTRRVGLGLRDGDRVVGVNGFENYSIVATCGQPMWTGDWFVGLEHPAGWTEPQNGDIVSWHYPAWSVDPAKGATIECFTAVFGVAAQPEHVRVAFADYLRQIRLPAITETFVSITAGCSQRAFGAGEYLNNMDVNDQYLSALIDLDIRPDAVGIDAGYFERRSLFRAKDDDDQDTRLTAFARRVRDAGMKLALWVSHNGRTGFDMAWAREQGWQTGSGPGSYGYGAPQLEFIVMMQPEFENALATRWEQLVGRVGASHLKIDWDNECATNGSFAQTYPTFDHVREASVCAFLRIDKRMRAINPDVLTRNGWWPSPWWLCHANHFWLANSGDVDFAVFPSRTQQDRETTQRDACYDLLFRRAESPVPLNSIDNHGFAVATDTPCYHEPHTWLDNLIMQFTRGTLYMHFPMCIESLRQREADTLRDTLAWFRHHARQLGDDRAMMVGGRPQRGEIYGYLHPGDNDAWLVLRNPSPQPQTFEPIGGQWLGWAPRTARMIHPFWQDMPLMHQMTLLGHEVRLLRCYRDEQPDASPIRGAPYMVRQTDAGYEYAFPGHRQWSDRVGPTVHPQMQVPGWIVEPLSNGEHEGGWRKQWFVGVPHRMERPELFVTIRATQRVLDGLTLIARGSRYRTAHYTHTFPVTRVMSQDEHPKSIAAVEPPVGERTRDNYAFGPLADGGWSSITLDIHGPQSQTAQLDCWLTGYESPARQTVTHATGPMSGPLLPMHPYGFASAIKLP